MGWQSFVKGFVRPEETKASRTGPLIAWSQIGQPQWTPRRYDALAEEGLRKNVVVYRCISMIATAVAGVPWLLYQRSGVELEVHPLLALMEKPNPMQDGVSFLEVVCSQLLLSGNAYVEAVAFDEGEAPRELYALRADRMKVVPGQGGFPAAYEYSVNGQTTRWPVDPVTARSSVLHIKAPHPLNDWYGLAPLEAAMLSVDQHNAAGAWNQALLNRGARPSGALVYAPKDGPSTLSEDQMSRLRGELDQHYTGASQAGRPLVLEGGLDWREMSLSPKEMDWMAGRDAAARDIALAFGVPAQLIGLDGAQTYANMQEARLAFYEETVLPLLSKIMCAFDGWLTPMFGEGLYLDFDRDEISALTARRDALWDKVRAADFLTINEKRAALGYGPVENGDALGA